MKSIARGYIRWPEIDKDIEGIAKKCKIYSENRVMPRKSALYAWEWLQGQRIHTEIF